MKKDNNKTESLAVDSVSAGSIEGVKFAISDENGKTCVAIRDCAWEAKKYLDLQNVAGANYAVVVVYL